jgi:glycosyltransferase involved in cell wall biosynthesis
LIIIDGKSTDESTSIIEKNIDIIKYCESERDDGVYDAWNKGLAHAIGQYIMFLGSDDLLESRAIEKYVAFIDSTNEAWDIISSKAIYTNKNGYPLGVFGDKWTWRNIKRNMCVSHVGMLTNRKIFEKIGNFSLEYKMCADYDLMLRAGANLKAAFLDRVTVKMRTGGISFTVKAIGEAFRIKKKRLNGRFVLSAIEAILALSLFLRMKIRISLSAI